ncbi:MAG: CotH kinase family protein [Bacteroidales bacterium]|nr:CotH kinase family protein [Bacteroidales bacterium]
MQRTIEYLYNRFLTGMKPTTQDFQDLMDSFFHKADLDEALKRLEQISLGDGEAWQVDGTLDEGSEQPVQNKVVAARLRLLSESIGTTNERLGRAMEQLSEVMGTLGGKASQADLEALQGRVTAFLREIAEYRQDTAGVLAEMDEAIAGKVEKNQGVSQAGKVLTVGADGKVTPQEPSSDGNTLNLGKQADLVAAISTVPARKRQPGRCVTWLSDGRWECKQFVGESVDDWLNEALWKDYGGGGSLGALSVNGTPVVPTEDGSVDLEVVTGLKVNGAELAKDSQGKVNIPIDTVEVDQTLDATSSNAVANSAVAPRLTELQQGMITGAEVEQGEDADGNPMYNLVLGRQYGSDITVPLPATGGGGSANLSRIVLQATVSSQQVKEGGYVELTYHYDHLNGDGESDGTKAAITIIVKKGSTITMQRTMNDVSAGSYTMNISDALQAGTMDVYVQAVCQITNEETGDTQVQTKQAYKSVTVVQIGLTTSYDLAGGFATGGYLDSDTITIPWAVRGSGTKVVSLVVDGDENHALSRSKTITKSGTTNDEFLIAARTLTPGRHWLQLVAEVGDIKSESIWIDVLKSGGGDKYIGLMYIDDDGTVKAYDIQDASSSYPTLRAGQYEQLGFQWAAYDPAGSVATVVEREGGATVNTMAVGRTMQSYTNRFNESGVVSRELVCGGTQYPLTIMVSGSAIDLSEAVGNLALRLKASGRSNGEANPAQWTYEGITTSFENVDWDVSGWDGESLVLKNGARAIIDIKPFASDPGATGLTVEMEYMIENPTDRTGDVISCHSGDKGFRITTELISLLTGSTKSIVDDDTGESIEKPAGVSTNYASGEWIKVAFVIGRRSSDRLMELYVNGVRCSADVYGSGDSFMQTDPVGITIESGSADVKYRIIRVYTRALSDDEEFGNYAIDRMTGAEIYEVYENNDILESDAVAMDKLKAKGKGVLRVVRTGGLEELNATNDKSAKFYGDVYFSSPFGAEYDFVARNVLVQIQGTSSTKYPRKNYRITLNKGTGTGAKLYVGAEAQKEMAAPGTGVCEADRGNTKNYYRMRPGAIPINIFVCKKDFSDSSMTHNTGASKLMNEVFKEMGILTPPQQKDTAYRTGFDGVPIDVFSSESADGESEYYGQYNFNNEKKSSGKVYGFDPIDLGDGTRLECLCCLEFLNNSEKLCNFQVDADLDTQLDNEFDNALEFRYPEDDTTWNGNPSSGKPAATSDQKAAIKRLFAWIRAMRPAGAEIATRLQEQGGDDRLSTWVNAQFAEQVGQYFNVDSLLSWYVYTDYFMSVDQRAKNMMLATFVVRDTTTGEIVSSAVNGKWWFYFWDADTMLGDRNDSYLAYDYLLTRTTWDVDRNKYAFEGHGSWLWCLVLANMGGQLSTVANTMRGHLTNARVHAMFDQEQQGNWCERAYNKSGHFAYIVPQLEGVMKQGELTRYSFMYALKGTGQAHRHYTIENRFALLDAKYRCGQYLSDNIDAYVARAAGDAANTIKIVSLEPYYFGWGTNNNTYQIGIEAAAGERITLTLQAALTANDPIRVYGASRILELDLTGMAGKMTGTWNLNKCVKMRRLLMGMQSGTSGSWFMEIDNCRLLEEMDLTNQKGASTAAGSKELDLRGQTRLSVGRFGGTEVTSVVLAKGAPIETLVMPGTLTTLRLESLPLLTMAGLTVESYAKVSTLIVSGCPGVEWETLAGRCSGLQRLRVELGEIEGDGQDLVRMAARNLQGVDAQGNYVNYCALTGRYQLTKFISEEVKALYPELEILDPEYTMIEFDDEVSDPEKVSNLDNGTGYKFGTAYVPSGHIVKLAGQRHRVLGKVTGDGEMTYYPLHDKDSNYYADAEATENCTKAMLDGSEGDVMLVEPHYWFKGVNDFLNKKHYSCYSSRDEMPARPEARVLSWDDLTGAGLVRQNYKVLTGKANLQAAYSSDSSCAVVHVPVTGYRRVRYPSVPGSGFVGSLLVDGSGAIVKDVLVETLSGGFEPGMYLIVDVPEGATDLYFTVQKSAEFDCVVLSNSEKIEDMEPEWCEFEEMAGGVAESTVVGSKLRSVMRSSQSAGSISWTDFNYYSAQRGMQQVDWMWHNHVGNLFYAIYGTLDSQGQCGYGESSYTQPQNRTAALGMRDTVNPSGATTGAWYWNDADPPQLVSVGSVNALGYQNLFGDKYEMLDGVNVNVGQVDGKWVIAMPDGTERRVKGGTTSGIWIKAVVHGRWMDLIPAGSQGDSSTTFYCDYYYYAGSVGRVVYRSSYSAYAVGGVSFAHANNDASYTNAYVGSRLAFRGTLVKAGSVAAYKAASEVS